MDVTEYNSDVASYVAEGIVTGCRRYGESDRLLILFTLEKGRLSAIAKSSRKPKSKIRGATETFVKARYELAEGKTLDIVRQAEILDPHLGIRDSWTRLQLAGHVAEIVNKMTEEHMPDGFMYNLLSETLEKISEGRRDAVVRFKARLLEHLGVFPDLSGCAGCGSGRVKGDVHLTATHHGFLCGECAKQAQVWHPVPMKVLHILHDLRNVRGEVASGNPEEDDMLSAAEDTLTTLLQSFLQQGFKTSTAARHARKSSHQTGNIIIRDGSEPEGTSAEPECTDNRHDSGNDGDN